MCRCVHYAKSLTPGGLRTGIHLIPIGWLAAAIERLSAVPPRRHEYSGLATPRGVLPLRIIRRDLNGF